MDIQVVVEQKRLPLSKKTVKSLIKDFIQHTGVCCDEVCVHFVETTRICQLHAEFFNDATPTDCITFPMDGEMEAEYRALGDVFVCPETAIDYVKKHGGDAYQEVTLYVVHGLLHLLGYDDIDPKERRAMRAAEKKYLCRVAEKNLWLKACI